MTIEGKSDVSGQNKNALAWRGGHTNGPMQ
jgi:hypothetical protein